PCAHAQRLFSTGKKESRRYAQINADNIFFIIRVHPCNPWPISVSDRHDHLAPVEPSFLPLVVDRVITIDPRLLPHQTALSRFVVRSVCLYRYRSTHDDSSSLSSPSVVLP